MLENLRLAPALAGNLSDTEVHEVKLGSTGRYIKVECPSDSAGPITLLPPGDSTGYTIAVGSSSGIIPYTDQTLSLQCAGGDGDYVIWRWLP